MSAYVIVIWPPSGPTTAVLPVVVLRMPSHQVASKRRSLMTVILLERESIWEKTRREKEIKGRSRDHTALLGCAEYEAEAWHSPDLLEAQSCRTPRSGFLYQRGGRASIFVTCAWYRIHIEQGRFINTPAEMYCHHV
jgi:hypothetical protein